MYIYIDTLQAAVRGFLARRKFAAEKRAQEKILQQIIQLQAGVSFVSMTN